MNCVTKEQPNTSGVDLKNVKINELKTALDNLKRGFQARYVAELYAQFNTGG